MADGQGRGGTHRRGWFHRRQRHRSPAHSTETTEVVPPDAGDEAGGTPAEAAPPASLDQVLRRAAEARAAERQPDDEGTDD